VWTKSYFKVKILKLKCTKFDFGWGSAPSPAGGAYSAFPDPLAGCNKGLVLRVGEGEEKGSEGRRGKGK